MGDIKWIKITANIFENRKIRQIETLPDGDAVIVIWLKLLCLAGQINDNGAIYFTSEIPYTEEMMATQFNRPLNTIKMALQVFQEFGMIQIENDLLKISNWQKYQNIEGMERIREQTRKRVQKYREEQRKLMESQFCQYCGKPATGYDHILATARGGTDKDENKIPCCKECNRIKNDKPVVDFLNNNRDRINDEIVTSNEKLKKFISLCNVTNRYTVTLRNAIEEEEEEEKEKNKNNIKENINTKESANATAKANRIQKHKYGEYKNVLLTDEELEKIKDEYPDWQKRIENLSNYIASTGKSYKSHYATIRNWARRDQTQQQAKRPGENKTAQQLNDAYQMMADWAEE